MSVAEHLALGSNPFRLDFPSCHTDKVRSPGLHPAYWVEEPGLRPQNVTEYLSTGRERMLQARGPRPQSFLGLLPVITTDSAPKVFVRRLVFSDGLDAK